MMHFPLFQISLRFSRNFQTLLKISKMLPFPENFFDFHPTTNFKFPPIFPVSVHFPPAFREHYYSPSFSKPTPFSKNSPAFYILYVYFVSPYFDHDAFMHHPMHVLDVPASIHTDGGGRLAQVGSCGQ